MSLCKIVCNVEGVRTRFAIVTIKCDAMEFRGVGLNVCVLVIRCIIIVDMMFNMFLMVFTVILKNLLRESAICLLISYCCSIILFFLA